MTNKQVDIVVSEYDEANMLRIHDRERIMDVNHILLRARLGDHNGAARAISEIRRRQHRYRASTSTTMSTTTTGNKPTKKPNKENKSKPKLETKKDDHAKLLKRKEGKNKGDDAVQQMMARFEHRKEDGGAATNAVRHPVLVDSGDAGTFAGIIPPILPYDKRPPAPVIPYQHSSAAGNAAAPAMTLAPTVMAERQAADALAFCNESFSWKENVFGFAREDVFGKRVAPGRQFRMPWVGHDNNGYSFQTVPPLMRRLQEERLLNDECERKKAYGNHLYEREVVWECLAPGAHVDGALHDSRAHQQQQQQQIQLHTSSSTSVSVAHQSLPQLQHPPQPPRPGQLQQQQQLQPQQQQQQQPLVRVVIRDVTPEIARRRQWQTVIFGFYPVAELHADEKVDDDTFAEHGSLGRWIFEPEAMRHRTATTEWVIPVVKWIPLYINPISLTDATGIEQFGRVYRVEGVDDIDGKITLIQYYPSIFGTYRLGHIVDDGDVHVYKLVTSEAPTVVEQFEPNTMQSAIPIEEYRKLDKLNCPFHTFGHYYHKSNTFTATVTGLGARRNVPYPLRQQQQQHPASLSLSPSREPELAAPHKTQVTPSTLSSSSPPLVTPPVPSSVSPIDVSAKQASATESAPTAPSCVITNPMPKVLEQDSELINNTPFESRTQSSDTTRDKAEKAACVHASDSKRIKQETIDSTDLSEPCNASAPSSSVDARVDLDSHDMDTNVSAIGVPFCILIGLFALVVMTHLPF